MTYQTEFPDFPAADMPDIPATWRDISWHNDACPCFEFMAAGAGDSNYQSAAREFPNSSRFLISYYTADLQCLDVMQSDDWAAVLDYAESRRIMAAAYVERVGYNPFLDCPAIDPAVVAQVLAQ